MKLRKPCAHDLYDRHHLSEGLQVGDLTHCPGGVFLPDDTLVIYKENGEWQLPPRGWLVLNAAAAFEVPHGSIGLLNDLADALSVRDDP